MMSAAPGPRVAGQPLVRQQVREQRRELSRSRIGAIFSERASTEL